MTVSHAATQRRRRPPPTAPGATPPTPPTPSGALLEPLLPPTRLGPRPRWPARGDHRRDVVDAIRYVAHNGCVWRALPADFPPWRTVYGFYWRWNASGATAWLHNRLRARCRGVRLVWADAAYAGRLVAWAAALRLRVQLVRRRLAHAFEVLPRRWVVKRTFAWLSRYRRTVRDYERLPADHQAMVQWAMITIMTRRLARRHRPARTPTPALARAA
jgi:transposase